MAVNLYVRHYNFCRMRETPRATPATALGLGDRPWPIGELLDAALKVIPIAPLSSGDRALNTRDWA